MTDYLDANNRPIGFQRGTTWVILAPPGTQTQYRRGPAMTQSVVARRPPGRTPWRPGAGRAHRRRGSWLARHPAWPVTALLAGIPLWWALGFGDYMFILLAIPMAARLYAWSAQGNRRIRLPPGFGLWLLFLLVVLLGAATLSATAPGTLASPVSNRIISYGVRTAGYLGVTALLLFAGNLTERELPRAAAGLAARAGGAVRHRRRPGRRLLRPLPLHHAAGRDRPEPAAGQQPGPAGATASGLRPAAERAGIRRAVPTHPSPTPTCGVTAWPCCCPG